MMFDFFNKLDIKIFTILLCIIQSTKQKQKTTQPFKTFGLFENIFKLQSLFQQTIHNVSTQRPHCI